MGFLEDLLTNTFDPKYGFLGRPMSGALRSGIDLTRALPRQLAPVLTPWLKQENFQEDPNTTRLLDEILGGGLKEKLVDEPVSQNAGLREPVPAEQLLRQALLPDLTTADINPISKPSMDFPTGLPRTSEDVDDVVSTRHQIGGALESAAGLALDPSVLAIPSVPGMGGLFLPGIAENLGTNIGQEEYGKAAIDALFGGLISKHLAKGAAEPVIERGTNIQVPKGGYKVEPEAVRDYNREELDRPEFKNFSQEARDLEDAPISKRPLWSLGARETYDTRLVNMIDAYLKRIEPEAGRTLADVVPKDIFIEVNRDPKVVPQGAAFSKELNTLYINPDVFADKLPGEITSTILHELAHTRAGHSKRTFGKVVGEKTPVTNISISDETVAQLPSNVKEHTWNNLIEASKVSPEESKFLTGQEALMNNPNIRAISEKFEKNLGALNAPEFRRRRGLPTFEEEGEALPEVEAAPKEKTELVKGLESTEKQTEDFNTNEARQARRIAQEAENLRNFKAGTHDKYGNRLRESAPSSKKSELEPTEETISTEKVVSEPANILRKLLTETKLTKFNKSNLVAELEAKVGSSLPDEVKSNIPELLSELKERGWINEKVGGTYTLLIEPPKRITEINKGKESPKPTSDLEATLRASLENPPKKQVGNSITLTPSAVRSLGMPRNGRIISIESDGASVEFNNGSTRFVEWFQVEGGKPEAAKPTPKPQPTKLDDIVTELTDKAKKEKEVPEEVLLARKAAEKAGKKKPPKEPTEEVEEAGEGKKKAFDITLSDGSTHTVRAESSEAAQAKAEELLSQYNSTKTVDKVEEHLGSLERAAKYEIEPVKEGLEEVKDVETELRGAKKEEVKTFTEEEKLRKAQTKEKFTKRPFQVNLSNGRVVTIKARNASIAKEIAESRIRAKKSNLTVDSITEKESSLDSAISGISKKSEEGGWIEAPLAKLSNAIKAFRFGGDTGHLLRQGKQLNTDLLFSRNAKKVLDQFPIIFKGAKSEEFFKEYHDKLYADPDIKTMVDDFGLDLPGIGKHFKEEVFHGAGLAEKIPILGKYYAKPSERAYTIGLNFLRSADVKMRIGKLRKNGFTPENAPEKYKGLARAINIISQRGDFGPAYQKVFSDLSTIYGAPRAKAARLQNVLELFRGGTSGDVVRTTAAKTLAFNVGMYGLLAATTGAKFITDPESSDFGKIRVNDKITVDPWMGLGVTARTVAKLVTGERVSTYTGKTTKVAPREALLDEFTGGLAPAIHLAWEAMSGKDLRGYQVNRLESLLNVTPLTAESIGEVLSTGDIEDAMILSVLQFGGEGVDVFDYEKAQAKEERLKIERGIPVKGKKKNTNLLPNPIFQ